MRLLLLVALLIASCQSTSGPGVEGVETHFRAAAKLPSTGLGTSVQALLDKRGWTTATEVESAATAERDLWIDAAELRFLQAENENAYLLSARDAWRWLSLTRGGRAERAEQKERALRIYNHATAAFVLRFRKGLPLKEVAKIMDRSPNAICHLIMRAMTKLRESMGDTESLMLPPRAFKQIASDDRNDEQ